MALAALLADIYRVVLEVSISVTCTDIAPPPNLTRVSSENIRPFSFAAEDLIFSLVSSVCVRPRLASFKYAR